MSDIVALGEFIIDFGSEGNNSEQYPILSAHPGGAPGNLLAAVAKEKVSCAAIGKVGNDMFGKLLVDTMKKAGVETRGLLLDDSVFTTLAFVKNDENGDRSFSFARKPGADTCLRKEEIPFDLIDECKIFHFSTLSLTDEPAASATWEAVAYAKKAGKLLSFDPNYREALWKDAKRAEEVTLRGMEQADLIKISDNEVELFYGRNPQVGLEYIWKTYRPKFVAVTCGANGCYYRNETAEGFVPSLNNIQVVDTTGAGDIFYGTVLAGIIKSGQMPEKIEKETLLEIIQRATEVAGISTTKQGALASLLN